MRRVPRCWFQDKDGSYYRNMPLILAESRELLDQTYRAVFKRRLFRQIDDLHDEFRQVRQTGLMRATELRPGDVVVKRAPMRVAYPDSPILWTLDEPR